MKLLAVLVLCTIVATVLLLAALAVGYVLALVIATLVDPLL